MQSEKTDELPAGWIASGSHAADYIMRSDKDAHSGESCGYIESIAEEPGGFGTLMQMFEASEYLETRLKLTAWIKSFAVDDWASLWMRIDGDNGKMLGFYNGQDNPVKGDTEWTQYTIVLDVPKNSKNVAFGVLLSGGGKVWLDDIEFEVVDETVPLTAPAAGGKHGLQKKPRNLNFSEE